MPRAKRNKEVTLSKVKPKGRDHKENQLQRLQAAAQANPFCYLFSVGNMRNNHLKEVREKWKGSSIFWGMNGVARKALGVDPENEIVEGISEITKRLQGPVGLLFTSSPPSITLPWFQSYSASSYLRGGQISPKTVVLNKGPVQTASTEIGGQSPDLETLSHSIEPQLRKLGMPTELKMGVPTLLRDFDVARVGKVVSTENAQILKHILLPLSTFKIIPLCIFTNPNLSSAAENQDPDSTFSSTNPAIKESTSLNESTILLKLNQEDQRAVDESMKGITIGKKDGNNGNGRASKRKTRKEAIESNLKGDDMDQDHDDDEDEEMDDDDVMDDDAVGASMMLPDSMKVV